MHKNLNLFEYEVSENKKIELSNIEITYLLEEIFNDFDFFKYELNNDFAKKLKKCSEEIIIDELIDKRNYTTNSMIKELFNKYYDKNKTKKSVYQRIGKELKIQWKSVQKACIKNKIN